MKYIFYGLISSYRKILPVNLIILCSFILVLVFSNFIFDFIVESRKHQESVLSNVGTHFSVYLLESADFVEDDLLCCPFQESQPDFEQLEGFVAGDLKTRLLSSDMLLRLDEDSSLRKWIMDYTPVIKYRYRDKNIGFITMIGYNPVYTPALVGCLIDSKFVTEGRALEKSDRQKNFILVSREFAIRTGIKLNQRMSFGENVFTVAGIVSTNIKPESADIYFIKEDLTELLAEITDTFITEKHFNVLLVESNDVFTMDRAMASVKEHFGEDVTIKAYACYTPAETSLNLSNHFSEVILFAVLAFTFITTILTLFISQSARINDSLIVRANGGKSLGAFLMNFTENMVLLVSSLILFAVFYYFSGIKIIFGVTFAATSGLTLIILLTTAYLQVYSVKKLLR